MLLPPVTIVAAANLSFPSLPFKDGSTSVISVLIATQSLQIYILNTILLKIFKHLTQKLQVKSIKIEKQRNALCFREMNPFFQHLFHFHSLVVVEAIFVAYCYQFDMAMAMCHRDAYYVFYSFVCMCLCEWKTMVYTII